MFSKLFKPKAWDCVAPMSGKLIPMEQVSDPVFSSKSIGDGFAIVIENDSVVSPVSGEVVALFPTKHAIGIKASDRTEYLIHIGLDTVKYQGEGFEAFVAIGDMVKQGDLLLKVDITFFKEKGVDLTSPVVITNLNGRRVKLLKEGSLSQGEKEIFAILV